MPAVADSASSGSGPMRAASMFAQLGVVRAAASASAAVSAPTMAQGMLSAPVGGWDVGPATGPTPALAVLPAAPAFPDDGRQPFYEPGYGGSPRYVGAPRSAGTGPIPQVTTGPPRAQSRPATGPQPQLTPPALPRRRLGLQPRATTGPISQVGGGAGRGRGTPMPACRAARSHAPPPADAPCRDGSMRRPAQRRCRASARGTLGPGGGPARSSGSGPMPRAATGPMPARPPARCPAPGQARCRVPG